MFNISFLADRDLRLCTYHGGVGVASYDAASVESVRMPISTFGLWVGDRKYVDLEAAAHMHGLGPLGGDINVVG